MPELPAHDTTAARAMRAALTGLVDGPALDFLAYRARLTHVPRETPVLRAGDVCQTVWLVVEGSVRLCWYREGREHIGDFHLEQELVSDYSSFVTAAPSRLHLVTAEPSILCALTKADFVAAERQYPVELNRAMRHVAEGLTVTFANRIWSTLMDSPTDRYLALQREKPAWFTRFPQYMIASFLGLTPEGLSKLRRRLDSSATEHAPTLPTTTEKRSH
ncbi:Crp/Fnr family transcriptional regulator [Gemmatimonas sp.]|uniref:Crp/Fnr family transcriptional regulator n=1 Tax=Gemmatimonas sp. TaxID=1962908 RepID=UPI00333E37E9